MHIDHIRVAAPPGSEETARGYFVGLLDMHELEKPVAFGARGGCWFRKGACSVHVGIDPLFSPAKEAHPAFVVEDAPDLARRLAAAGYPVTWDDRITEISRFHTEDPFGNRLEFIAEGAHGSVGLQPTDQARRQVDFLSAVPHLQVEDVVRAAEYYRDVLGFAISGYWDGESVHHDPARPVVFGIVRRGEVLLHFNRVDETSGRSGARPGGYDIYFHVVGIDELASELRERGASVLEGPEDRSYDQREIIVQDLDGRVLAFGEDITRTSRSDDR